MWCLYLDHTNGDIDRDLFQPVLNIFAKRLIEPDDLRPTEINALTNAVNAEESILAFVHTAMYQKQWVQFAQEHEKVRLVLLSRNSSQFGGRQGRQKSLGCNVYGFAPASKQNSDLMTTLDNLVRRMQSYE